MAQVLPEPYVLMRPRIATAYVKSVKMGDRELSGPHIDFARLDGPLTILFGVDAGSVEGTALTVDGQPMMPAKITLIPVGSNQSWAGRLKIVNADEKRQVRDPRRSSRRIQGVRVAGRGPGRAARPRIPQAV